MSLRHRPIDWGLRAYGTHPQVWSNGHAMCREHEWQTYRHVHHSGQVEQTLSGKTNRGVAEAQRGHMQDICSKCGAWCGELGLEPTPELYVAHLVEVFRAVREVLTDDGTLWLNLGDSYATSPGKSNKNLVEWAATNARGGGHRAGDLETPTRKVVKGLKPKDLVGIPWMVAFALRADGWYLRSDIIWAKPNPMPESVRDRPTKAHEYIFLLSKSPLYFYDTDAVAEKSLQPIGQAKTAGRQIKQNQLGRNVGTLGTNYGESTRNRRSVWTVTTRPYKGAHFATFPPDLITSCVLAGSSEKGQCPKCGKPWVRVIERVANNYRSRQDRQIATGGAITGGVGKNFPDIETKTTGWKPSCHCGLDPIPDTVLDPFMGSGTTAEVAILNGRNVIGIELNPDYLKLEQQRVAVAMKVVERSKEKNRYQQENLL